MKMANNDDNQAEQANNHLKVEQRELMKAIETKNLEKFNEILAENPDTDLNFIDDDNMTPLQQASYRGNVEMVKILLKSGADVNKCEHQNSYTTIHFGALSGSVEVCQLLLAAGANPNALNSINRTAAQLASFVGYHNVVSTINNFIPKGDVDYYTRAQGAQTQPVLIAEIAENVYLFALMYNMHPVKIAMRFNDYGLIDHIDSVETVLGLMSEKEFKARAHNEMVAFKYHYLGCIVGEIRKRVCEKNENNPDLAKNFVKLFAKIVLKVNRAGNQEVMDIMIRRAVRSYPFIQSTLFRQIVASLAADEESPTALSIVMAAVNGQRAFVDETNSCGACGEEKAMKKCSQCKCVTYCNKDCQKMHWFVHKKVCRPTEAPQETVQVDASELNKDLANVLAAN